MPHASEQPLVATLIDYKLRYSFLSLSPRGSLIVKRTYDIHSFEAERCFLTHLLQLLCFFRWHNLISSGCYEQHLWPPACFDFCNASQSYLAVPVAAKESREIAVGQPLLRIERQQHATYTSEWGLQDQARERLALVLGQMMFGSRTRDSGT